MLRFLGWTAVGLLAYLLVCVIRILLADADLRTLKAARRYSPSTFRGKVVWIVGASAGIGEALALHFAQAGAHLILSARREELLQEVARKCMSAGAQSAVVQVCDVSNTAGHAQVVQAVVARHGRLDVLVQNAGQTQRALVDKADFEVDVDLFQLNVMGVLSLTKLALPSIIAAKGRILVTSSVAGIVPAPCSSTYSATKHALQGFFHTLRAELYHRGVKVTLACPGPVLTDIQANAATGKKGTRLNDGDMQATRMSATRCAFLMVAACAAGLAESWISPHPVLLMCYFVQYMPSFGEWVAARVGKKRAVAFAQGVVGYKAVSGPIWSVLFGKDKDQ